MLTTQKRSDQKHPCLTSGGNGCRGFCGGHRQQGHLPSAAPSEGHGWPLNTFLSSTRFPHRSLGNKGRMPSTCSVLRPNNWAITHLLLVLFWGSLPAERIIPHMMSPDPNHGFILLSPADLFRDALIWSVIEFDGDVKVVTRNLANLGHLFSSSITLKAISCDGSAT